jgi:(E)-4-hydroxy-3-methylbut-2-enyl-diphosphate synthase|tara:strand:+ start:1527 stop:3302 length:1776 start_codon:yes stop_codon:yes gene_type:complete
MQYCASPYRHTRRETRPVIIGDPENGGVIVGGGEPIVRQSMLISSTLDTDACIEESMALVNAGCQIVRITAQTKKYAANLKNISAGVRARGSNVPLVADIHFKPDAAMEAVKWCEVLRVNPGNYADFKKFAVREYTDEQYAAELERIEERFAPLVEECKTRGRALRIGTNHGSLSDRIMNRFGDTPLGMVESALEFALIARKLNFHNFKFSMKSSNPKVMIECYRLLAARLAELGSDWSYPLHLGVTEAGEGEDGRIKSAIGIGSLLFDGLGDTIRVSLTEDSLNEIVVCDDLIEQVHELIGAEEKLPNVVLTRDPFDYQWRDTAKIELADGVKCGGEQTIRVIVPQSTWDEIMPRIKPGDDVRPEAIYEKLNVMEVDPREEFVVNCDTQLVTVKDDVELSCITAFRLLAGRLKAADARNPILLKDCLSFRETILEPNISLLRASVVIGALLCDGIGDAILVRGESGASQSLRLAYNILQAAGCRSFKADYVACPSCGRTLFDLQEITALIKARTEHLKGVKIAIMGCIVNGPGEMADADFGYVGGAPNMINLYVGKEPVRYNVSEGEAVESLIDLIKERGKWVEPQPALA